MAELNTASPSGNRTGVPKGKKLSTRVDLTPMVDLGFLLITFFIFTTQLARPTALKMIMPAPGPPMPVGKSSTLTLVPLANNTVFYFHGQLDEALQQKQYGITGYSYREGIGEVIRQKQKALAVSGKDKEELMLIIKPTDQSVYRNTVDLLDEVVINAVKHYAITDISDGEAALIASHRDQ